MNSIKVFGLLIIAMGIAGLAYGGFSSGQETHSAQVGDLSVSVTDQHRVNIPVWAGVAAIVIGAGLVLVPIKT